MVLYPRSLQKEAETEKVRLSNEVIKYRTGLKRESTDPKIHACSHVILLIRDFTESQGEIHMKELEDT